MKLRVRCPKCKNTMLCEPKQGPISGKVKRCVYCGYSFKIHSNLEKSRIVERV